MQLDSGRIKDMQMLEHKLKSAGSDERRKILSTMDEIKRQAEIPELNQDREAILNARRATINAKGEVNIKNARDEADKLEGYVHNKHLT